MPDVLKPLGKPEGVIISPVVNCLPRDISGFGTLQDSPALGALLQEVFLGLISASVALRLSMSISAIG